MVKDEKSGKEKTTVHFFEDKKITEYKKKVISAFEESGGKVYEKDVPLRMSIRFYLSVPKSASQKKRFDLISNFFPTKRPDNDNLYKGIADALNGVAYYDDVVWWTDKFYLPRTWKISDDYYEGDNE